MTSKHIEPEELRAMAREALRAADGIDDAEGSRPDTVDAGPFTSLVIDMFEATAAQTVDLVMRLRTAAVRMRQAAEFYEYQEELGVGQFQSVEQILENFDHIDSSKPTYGEMLDDLRGDDDS